MDFVTSGSLGYFQAHGGKFVGSFLEHVDPSVSLRIYGEFSREQSTPEAYVQRPDPRITCLDLFTATPLGAFLEAARPAVEKRIGPVPLTPKERLKSPSYDYRFDALTFGRKVLSICHALGTGDPRTVVWTDLDIAFHRTITPAFIEGLFAGRDVFYFGRSNQHSETGVLGFRTGARGVLELARRMEECLTSLAFTKLPGWTDCHIFDHVRAGLEKEKVLSAVNLSPGQEGHVIARSCLAPYLDHMKGPRKLSGSSPERNAHLKKKPR